MTNSELNQLSITELRELAARVNETYKRKMAIECMINAGNIEKGMTVEYIGSNCSISNEHFIVEKVNTVNATCKNTITGIRWDLKLANIKQVVL
jgi:hypothetical protein